MSKRPDPITVADAAELTGIPRRTLAYHIAKGNLPHVHKLDGERGAYLLDVDTVHDFARSRSTDPAVAS